MLILTRDLTVLQFGVVTDFSEQMLNFDGHWKAGDVCSSRRNPGFSCTGQMADSVHGVCERFADVNVVNSAPWLWWGYYMGRHKIRTMNSTAFYRWQFECRYRDEILRPIVVPFIHCHHLMFQHDNEQPHVTRICTQFLEGVPVLPWSAYSPDMSPI
jgi:hypothetical protein